jgi:conjugative relaxase-like TrwC/TraI family protein
VTASLHKLGTGRDAGKYYTNDSAREAKPSTRDEYYTRDGDGVWWSSGESVVRHGAAINRESFRDLCAGLHPGTGRPLVRGAGEGHQAGLDITLSAPKGLSILWASGTPDQRAAIERAQAEAVEDVLQFLLDEKLVAVRVGAGGSVRLKPDDLIVARFNHYTSRGGDPQVHTHCVCMNVAGSSGGSGRYKSAHLTTETSRVFDWKLAVGAAFRSALSERLAAQGLAFRPAGQRQFEIAGIPATVLAAFSKRSEAIEAHAGAGASSAQRAVATLATRTSKEQLPTGDELEGRWRDELEALKADPWRMARDPGHDRDREETTIHDLDPPEIAGDGPVARAASALFRHENVLDRKSVLEHSLAQASLQGLGIAAVRAEIARLERSGALIRLSETRLDERWTTPALAAAEAALLRAADRKDERDWISPQALDEALSAAAHLSDEQRDAVRHVAGQDGVTLIEAAAGTGKTVLAAALVDSARRSNLKVIGLAPSWVAADELSASTGIEAFATAKWRHDRSLGRGISLDAETLVIVDEAGMASTRDLAGVLAAAHEAGAKCVLVGDRRQLSSVAGASALRAVADVVGRNATMREIRRQEEPWQKAASILMARGDVDPGLRAYAQKDKIELVSGEAEARARVIACWREARARYGEDVLILTRRNQDAAALNRAARDVLKSEKRVASEDVVVTAIDRAEKAGNLELAVGDTIRFGETVPKLGIRNGTRANVLRIGPDSAGSLHMAVQLESGREIGATFEEFAREPVGRRRREPPRIVHSYAGTVYSAQGRTTAASVIYVSKPTDAREVYVGLTRHRYDATLVVERDRLEAAVRMRQTDPRTIPRQADLLERLYQESRTYREKANVVDFVEDRIGFIRTGVTPSSASVTGTSNVSRAFAAGRALRAVLRAIEAAPRLMLSQLPRIVRSIERAVPSRVAEVISALRNELATKRRGTSPSRRPDYGR